MKVERSRSHTWGHVGQITAGDAASKEEVLRGLREQVVEEPAWVREGQGWRTREAACC